VVAPFMILVLREGFGARDPKILQMAQVFNFSRFQKIVHVALPDMSSFLYAALRNGFALGWKVLVLFEIFSASTGIGFQYKNAFDFFDVPRLFTWMAFFLMLVIATEYGVLRPLERRALRWR